MLATLGRRLGTAALTLLLVTWVVFALFHLLPGDVVSTVIGEESLGPRLPPERVAELRELYHLDRPILEQYGLWLLDLSRGDLGRSFHDRRPVGEGYYLSPRVAPEYVKAFKGGVASGSRGRGVAFLGHSDEP